MTEILLDFYTIKEKHFFDKRNFVIRGSVSERERWKQNDYETLFNTDCDIVIKFVWKLHGYTISKIILDKR